MAGLQEQEAWEDEIYQIETTDPVHGGPPDLGAGQGHTNAPHQQLANRTKWLKAQLDALATANGGKLDASAFTAAAILAMLKTVDGVGSGVDAELLGGVAWDKFVRRDGNNDLLNLGGEKRMHLGWSIGNNRFYLAPRLADGSDWDWGANFGFDRVLGNWFSYVPFFAEGYRVYHEGNAATQAQAQAGTAGKLVLAEHLAAVIADHINALLDGAPAAMDTLKELSDAITGNDDDIALLVGQVASKLDSASFTGAAILALLDGLQIKSGSAWIEDGDIVWEDGVNRITHNDGNGNVQIRLGHDSSENFSHDGTAFYLGGNLDNADGALTLKVASNGGAGTGQAVTWGDELTITKDGITFAGIPLQKEPQSAADVHAMVSALSNSHATAGYQELPGGLILQWGEFTWDTGSNGSTKTVTLPLAFPTAHFQTFLSDTTGDAGGTGESEGSKVSAVTLTDFTVRTEWGNGVSMPAATPARFFSIGK